MKWKNGQKYFSRKRDSTCFKLLFLVDLQVCCRFKVLNYGVDNRKEAFKLMRANENLTEVQFIQGKDLQMLTKLDWVIWFWVFFFANNWEDNDKDNLPIIEKIVHFLRLLPRSDKERSMKSYLEDFGWQFEASSVFFYNFSIIGDGEGSL